MCVNVYWQNSTELGWRHPVMDPRPTQRRAGILLVTSYWISCDGLASHPGCCGIHRVVLCTIKALDATHARQNLIFQIVFYLNHIIKTASFKCLSHTFYFSKLNNTLRYRVTAFPLLHVDGTSQSLRQCIRGPTLFVTRFLGEAQGSDLWSPPKLRCIICIVF